MLPTAMFPRAFLHGILHNVMTDLTRLIALLAPQPQRFRPICFPFFKDSLPVYSVTSLKGTDRYLQRLPFIKTSFTALSYSQNYLVLFTKLFSFVSF